MSLGSLCQVARSLDGAEQDCHSKYLYNWYCVCNVILVGALRPKCINSFNVLATGPTVSVFVMFNSSSVRHSAFLPRSVHVHNNIYDT